MKRILVLGSTTKAGLQALDLVRTLPDRLEVVVEAAHADLVVAASSAALAETLEALRAGLPVVLASNELMVMAGDLLMAASARHRASIIPADPALSAMWQCLRGEPGEVKRIILTAQPSDELAGVGTRAIAAHHLFGLPYERMEVVTHPEGVVQAMVEFIDGSVKAVFAESTPLLSLQHALSYPERWEGGDAAPVDLVKVGRLTFEPNPCLDEALLLARACYPESPNPITRGVT